MRRSPPTPAKSFALRVASADPAARAIPAIWASAVPMTRPTDVTRENVGGRVGCSFIQRHHPTPEDIEKGPHLGLDGTSTLRSLMAQAPVDDLVDIWNRQSGQDDHLLGSKASKEVLVSPW